MRFAALGFGVQPLRGKDSITSHLVTRNEHKGRRAIATNEPLAGQSQPQAIGLRAWGRGFLIVPQTIFQKESNHGSKRDLHLAGDGNSRLTIVSGSRVGSREAAQPAPPLPVLYQLTWLGTLGGANSSAFDMNNRGEVVGYAANSNGSSRAFLYTTQTGMVDLNTLADTWVDLGAPEDPAEGWIAKYAYGTNDVGQIVGMARNAAAEARAFLFDPTGESPRFFLLPTLSAGEHRAVAINDFGDIVGYWEDPGVEWRYFLYTAADGQMTDLQTPSPCLDPGHARSNVDINNAGQIVTGTGWRYTPGGEGWRFFANLYPQGINQAGTFVGNAALWKGKNNLYDAAFRFRDPGPAEILLQCSSRISPTAIAFDVNSSGDVCVHGVQSWPDGRRGYLYTDQHGLLRLDDLVTGSPEALARWAGWDITPFAINDRDETGFGQIWGFRYSVSNGVGVYSAFLLTPVRP